VAQFVVPELLIDFQNSRLCMSLQGLDWKEDAPKAELMGPEFQLGCTL